MKKKTFGRSMRQAQANVKARKAKALAISEAEAAKRMRRKERPVAGAIAALRTAMGLLALMLAQKEFLHD